MNKPLRVLLVEDSERDAALLTRQLRLTGYEPLVTRVESAAELTIALPQVPWDLVISDYRLPQFSGLDALEMVKGFGRDVPFILVSGVIGEDQAVEAMKAGAHDFVLKDRLSRLVPAVERELREAEVRRQQRQAAEDLRRAKQDWERTFDSVPDLIAILDGDHRITRANEAMAHRLGKSPEDCVGLRCCKAVHGIDGPPANCPHVRTLADGAEHVAEIHEPRLGGHFLVTTTPLRDEADRMVGAVHVARDITERKRAEVELQENQERLLLAQRAGHVGVFDVNLRTGATVWTGERKVLFGVPPAFNETRDAWIALLHPEDRRPVETTIERALQARRRELDQSYRICRPDGQVRWIEDRALITYDDAGAPLRLVGTTTDITEYKRAQERLRSSARALRNSAIRGVVTLGLAIFAAETLVMMVLSLQTFLSAWQAVLIDSTALLLLASPALYFSAFRPLVRLLHEREQAQADLCRVNDELEARVRERTASLETANQKLQGEIADRKQAQAALAEAHRQEEEALARLDALFQSAPLGLGFWDTELRSLRINPALAAMSGSAEAQPHVLLPQVGDVPERLADWRRVLATGQPQLNVELSGETPAHPGERRWWVGNWFPVAVQGQVIGLGATLLDITEQRRAQDGLRQAHDLLEQQVRERTADLVAANTQLQRANRALKTLSACNQALVETTTESQLLHRVCQLLVGTGGYRSACIGLVQPRSPHSVRLVAQAGADAEPIDPFTERAPAGGPVATALRTRRPCLDRLEPPPAGDATDVTASLALPFQAPHELLGVVLIRASSPGAFDTAEFELLAELANDLAFGLIALRTRQERDHAAQALERWAQLFQRAHWGVAVGSADGTVLEMMNPAYARMHGYNEEELTGAPILSVYAPESRPEVAEQIRQTHQTGRAIFESRHLRKDGTNFPALVDMSAVRDEQGRVLYRVVYTQDISELKSLEARILDISEREQQRIGQDLHDSLCQQLSGIAYLCHTAQERVAQAAPGEAPALSRMSQLLQEAVDQARGLAHGLHPVEPEPNGLAVALQSLVSSFRGIYRVSARFLCAKPVLLADNAAATHLYRIAQEAMGNAVRHGRASQIIVRLAESKRHITLLVKDNGCGFPTELPRSRGLGLETMRFRARAIGAALHIRPGDQGGTVVTCTMSKTTDLKTPEVTHD